jgi:predicted ATPase
MNAPALGVRSDGLLHGPGPDLPYRATGQRRIGDTPDAAAWRVRLLGGFEIDNGRHRLTRLRSQASMALLARLAMDPGRDHGRDELAALLWPDACPTRARSRLRQTLSLLRVVLEPPGGPAVLHADHWVLRLRPGALWCDVLAFEAALARRDLVLARKLYRGDLLPGVYAEWLEDERRRLSGRAEGLLAEPLPLLPSSTVLRPTTPQADRSDAKLPASARLPQPVDAGFGLDTAAAALQDLMATHRLVTVLGPAGIGKTRLAVQACEAMPQAGSVRFVAVAGLRTPAQLLRRLRAVLRVAAGPRGLEHLADRLGDTPGTLVLDGCESLDADARAWVSAALSRLPALQVLVTSRCPLGLPAERLYRVAPLPLPQPEVDAELASLSAQAAVALFIDRARAVRPEFHLHRGNVGAVVALLQRLDGWPLAIELAAAQMHHTNPAMLLAAFAPAEPPAGPGRALELMVRRGSRRTGERPTSLAAVLDDNLRLLDSDALALLRQLAGRPGDWPAAAARSLATTDAGWAGLAALVDLGLLRTAEDPQGRPIYRLGSLLRCRLAA